MNHSLTRPSGGQPRMAVLGASGLLGANLLLDALSAGYDCLAVTGSKRLDVPGTAQLDVRDSERLADTLLGYAPDVIVNCVAVTSHEMCEQDPALAQALNAELPGRLSSLAKRAQAHLVHISTDAVFDGQRGDYRETDDPSPASVYGATKLAGEAAARADVDALVLRVNFYGWSPTGTRSLAEYFYNSLEAGRSTPGFTDVVTSPTYVRDLDEVLLELISRRSAGLFHAVGREPVSKFEFGRSLAKVFDFEEALVVPRSWRSSELTAERGSNCSLNTDRLKAELGRAVPSGRESLNRLRRDRVRARELDGLLVPTTTTRSV